MKVRLIVNADDYGRTAGVSAGIRAACRDGIVTSTTAMLNMPGIADELRRAWEEFPALGLGVHLNLTAGPPLLSADRLPGWVTPDGRFLRPEELAGRYGGLDPTRAADEWRAQIEAFATAVGHPPDHLDSHHHISYVTEALFRAMLELAREYGCAIRLPLPAGKDRSNAGLPGEWFAGMRQFAPELLRALNPRRPDRFVGTFYGEMVSVAALTRIIADLPAGSSELMVHPGYADPELRSGSGYAAQREDELRALCDPAVRAALAARGVELITFAGV